MRKANISEIPQETWQSPSGKFKSWGKTLNDAIGGDSRSMDLTKRWPFDVELAGIPPGAANCPYHSHSTQWEFYIIVSGTATVRHKEGQTEAVAGDFFMFGPGEPHQILNRGTEEMTYYCIADNPIGDHAYYPDSDKHLVRVPDNRTIIKGSPVTYFHGEDEPPTEWVEVK